MGADHLFFLAVLFFVFELDEGEFPVEVVFLFEEAVELA